MFGNNSPEKSHGLVDQAVQSAEHAVHSAQRAIVDARDSVAESVRDTSRQLRDKALQASQYTASYVKHEPVKAMLIAAATGAALMALISLISRTRDRP